MNQMIKRAADKIADGLREALDYAKSQWKPIDTAPRDGTAVLLWRAGADDPRVAWFGTDIEDGSTAWIIAAGEFFSVVFDAPTHWMALPEVPK
jgi:hypothetical protein